MRGIRSKSCEIYRCHEDLQRYCLIIRWKIFDFWLRSFVLDYLGLKPIKLIPSYWSTKDHISMKSVECCLFFFKDLIYKWEWYISSPNIYTSHTTICVYIYIYIYIYIDTIQELSVWYIKIYSGKSGKTSKILKHSKHRKTELVCRKNYKNVSNAPNFKDWSCCTGPWMWNIWIRPGYKIGQIDPVPMKCQLNVWQIPDKCIYQV